MKPGVYRHHKGGLYTVLFTAVESTNSRAGAGVVVYVSHTTGKIHTRDIVEFVEEIDTSPSVAYLVMAPRFEFVG